MPELEAIAAPTRDAPMHGLEAIAAPTHDAATLPLRDSTISESVTRLRRPTLKANAAPTHDAPTLTLLPLRDRPISEGETRLRRPTLGANTAPTRGAPTLSLRDSTIFKSETRLRRPTLNNLIPDPSAETGTPTVQYAEFFACIGALSRSAEKHGGKIAMLIEKDLVAQENLCRRCPGAEIFYDVDDDSEWRTFERKPGTALGMFAGPLCQPFAPTGEGLMGDDPRA